ncbi:tyrosine-type recombinase/integrase [Roseomonas rosulenta]|uniref:tyrosine-type recombinase/integrase n=1 Tax=Roseomonas rosulenta TaxID=2748667 RepID=UPI0018DF52C9|nr:tyrosine-type recombinase/integrase [Roseomonas rosulenta]
MATINARPTRDGMRFTAQIRMRGIRLNRTFATRRDAERWGILVEDAIAKATDNAPFDPTAYLPPPKTAVPVVAPPARPATPGEATQPMTITERLAARAAQRAASPEYQTDDALPSPSPAWSLRRAIQHYLDSSDGLHRRTEKTQKTNSDRLRRWTDAEEDRRTLVAALDAERARPEPNSDRLSKLAGRLLAATHRIKIASQRLDSVSAHDLQSFIDHRTQRQRLNASTVRNEIYCLSAVFEFFAAQPKARGKGGRGLDIKNPVPLLELPNLPPSRDRRLTGKEANEPSEWDRVIAALRHVPDGPEMEALITVQIETGMRPGEVRSIKREWIKSRGAVRWISIREGGGLTKQVRRKVILSNEAWSALRPLIEAHDEIHGMTAGANLRLFTLSESEQAYRWKRAREIAKCPDLRLHDLRHEGLSRQAEVLTIGELQQQSGHKTASSLLRYLHARPDHVAEKLKNVRRD